MINGRVPSEYEIQQEIDKEVEELTRMLSLGPNESSDQDDD